MNTPLQNPKPNGAVQPSSGSPGTQGKSSAVSKPPGLFTIAALLAGLVLLLVGAPAAHADRSPPGCSGSGLGISLFTSLPDVHIGDTIYYSVNVFNTPFPACDAGATNPAVAGAIQAFVVTPDGFTNNVTLRRTYLLPGESDFYTNVVGYVVRSQDILPDGTVRATAVDEGDIHQNDTNSRGGGNQGVNTEVNLPCIKITVQCTSSVGETGLITFTGTVTNCGNNTLVGVTVTNLVNGGQFPVTFITNLDRGQIASFSGSWIPLNPCDPSTATLVAQGTDEFTSTPRTVTDSASTTCSEALTPGIALTTECVPATVYPGQALPYRGTVRNTGNVTLTNVVVVGDKPSPNTQVFTASSLAPGATADFEGNYTAPFACNSTAAFSVSGQSICDQPVSANSSITCPIATAPMVTVTSVCPTTPPAPGTELVYSGTVANGGNVTLQNVRVFSQQTPNTPVFTVASLDPGATANFSGRYTTPANACSVSDTLTVIGQDACSGANVTNVFTSTCLLSVTPLIEVTRQCPEVAPAPGAALTYSGTVRNPGNVALTDVVVVSDLPEPNTVVFTAANLAAGASASFTGSIPAPTDACSVMFTLTASGKDACGSVPVTANVSSACLVASNPRIVITRNCPEVPPLAGTPLAYTATVQNAGDVTLTNIVVVSDHPTANTQVFTAPSLAPGASLSFTGSYATPADACSATDTLTATGRDQCSGQAVSDARATTCPLSAAGQIKLAVNCPATPAAAGGPIAFTGTVSNPGNVTLTNVVVVNDAAPGTPVFTVGTLAPQASANFSATAQTPANSCSATASFTATATDRCGSGSVRDTVAVTCPLVNSPAIVVTHECPATQPAPGESVTFAGTVRNAGNVTLNNVTVRNGEVTVYGPATLEPNASANFTGSYSVPADTCSVTTTLTATGADTCDSSKVVSNTSTKSCPVKMTPRLLITKTCPPNPVAAGGQITYGGTLQNAGNVTLTDIVVNRGTDHVFGPVSLAPGASTSFTGSSSVPVNVCSITETWAAVGKDKCSGAAVSESATTTCPVITTPKIRLALTCPTGPITPGTSFKYGGTVNNLGDVALNNIVVLNTGASGTPVFTLATLAAGASASFSADGSAPADTCSVSASFTVSAAGGCEGGEGGVTDAASITCPITTHPQIAVTHNCPTEASMPGYPSSYSGRVSNTGDVTLTNVVVLNSLSGNTVVFGPVTLAPGQSADFTASYTLPTSLQGCSIDSHVTATGADKCTGANVSADEKRTCPVQQAPGLKITFICPEQLYAQGEHLHYRAIIRNVGNVRLENVKVFDSLTGDRVVWSRESLSVGETHEMENTRMIPENCCSVTTTLHATAVETCAGTVVDDTSTGTCPIRYNPKLAVTATCPEDHVESGETGVFTGTVSNPGDVTLSDVSVYSNAGEGVRLLGPIALAPGQAVQFKGNFQASDACGGIQVTATSGQHCGGATVVTASVKINCPVETSPMIVVTKQCPYLPVASGDIFLYSGTVVNAGNVTLTDVIVVNNKPSKDTRIFGPITLAPGESRDFTGSYKLETKCCETVDTLTARGRDRCTGQTVENTATAVCPVLWTASLQITKQCRSDGTFTGIVKNTGGDTVTNVTVVVEVTGESPTSEINGSSQILGPIELAAGETAHFSGSSTGDPMVVARGISLCQKIAVEARANCAGPEPDKPLAIDSLSVSAGQVTMKWQSIPGQFYRVEYKNSAADQAWQPLPGEVQATQAISEKSHTFSGEPQRFYRVIMLQ